MRTERGTLGIYGLALLTAVLATGCRVGLEPGHDHHHLGAGSVERAPYVPAPRASAEKHEQVYSSLVPILDCVEELERGRLRAHFGFENGYDEKLYVPIGEHNEFKPAPKDRDQPIYFKPGVHERVFSLTLEDSQSVTWLLEGGKALANADSPRPHPAPIGTHLDERSR